MAINNKKFQNITVSYKDLKDLSIGDRVSFAGSSYGAKMLSALTPEQYAALFPAYYLKRDPDVSGFYKAISRQSRQLGGANQPSPTYTTGGGGGETTGTSGAPAAPTASVEGRATVTGGSNKEIIMKAFASELRRQGVPAENIPYAVAALAGQVQAESNFNPTLEHDNGTGYGIYGARDPSPGRGRKTDMLNWLAQNGYDKNSAEGQARFMVHEMFTNPAYTSSRNAVSGANRENQGEVSGVLVNNFERPAERAQNIINRTNYAMGHVDDAHSFSQAQVGSENTNAPTTRGTQMPTLNPEQRRAVSGIAPMPNETSDQLAKRINDLVPGLKNTECVELAKGIVNDRKSVTEWRRGESIRDGNIPIGTPIATFMDRSGNTSNLYDGGQGVGLGGSNTTHAAVLEGYVRDNDGKIVGIRVQEQGGGAGPRAKEYRFGDRRGGLSDAGNYYVVNDAEGNPLGKENNPYFRQQMAQAQMQQQASGPAQPAAPATPTNLVSPNQPSIQQWSPYQAREDQSSGSQLVSPDQPPVRVFAEGGVVRTDSQKIEARPIDKLKGDNSVVVDENQKPLFTMNTNKETASYDPARKTVEVSPVSDSNMRTNPDDLQPSTTSNIPAESDVSFERNDPIIQQQIITGKEQGFEKLIMSTDDPFNCPSFRRAIAESNFSSGDDQGLGIGHYGDRNYTLS